eukprot:1152538-Pelagomonas_calceolata.AAC.1
MERLGPRAVVSTHKSLGFRRSAPGRSTGPDKARRLAMPMRVLLLLVGLKLQAGSDKCQAFDY